MGGEFLSKGQALATEQLADIAFSSYGALEVVELIPPSADGGSLVVRISIETTGYERIEGGFAFRPREALRLDVPQRYPIEAPRAYFAHKRFMGRPHVQWGNFLCLYQSTDVEWSANDGMYGFVARLDRWLCDAAMDRLDREDAPLHPPVVYTSSDIKLAIEIDAPEIEPGKHFWLGVTTLSKRNRLCYDVAAWSGAPEKAIKEAKLALALMLPHQMPMEYPGTVSGLLSALTERGIPFTLTFETLKIIAEAQDEGDPLYFILGAPMRRRAAGEPLCQHLAAWSIAPKYVSALREIVLANGAEEDAWALILEWATKAETEWCRVYDNRPEVTFRRDHDASAHWFFGKSVAILGCGALGSHIGEYVVRAGASKIRLVDNSMVGPGLLTRQQFEYWQVGFTKESALGVELSAINPSAEIEHLHANLIRGWPSTLRLEDYDLIIDTTASRRVAAALQLDLQELQESPPILRCAIDARASRGIATMRSRMSRIGPSDLIRQTKLFAATVPDLTEFSSSFWPKEQFEPGFQPEPGCSEPTFVGSAADVAFFASSFLNFAAEVLPQTANNIPYAFYVSSSGGMRPDDSMASRIIELEPVEPQIEVIHGYRVVVSAKAQNSIRSEIHSNARQGRAEDETGGLLLGEIDDSLSSIYIDIATGPPPDSEKSPERFLCGIEGTAQQCQFHSERSGSSTKFVGVWHTHPVSMPRPSEVDLQAMATILHAQEKTPRQVAMLIVGFAAREPVWQFHLFRRNQFQILHIPPGELDLEN